MTDVVLGGLVSKFDHIAVLFFSTKRDKEVGKLVSLKHDFQFQLLQMVKNLETIADDCAEDDISLVRIDDKEEAGQYGLKKLPALLFFNFQVVQQFVKINID